MKGFVIGLFNKIFERSRMSDWRRNVLMLFFKKKGGVWSFGNSGGMKTPGREAKSVEKQKTEEERNAASTISGRKKATKGRTPVQPLQNPPPPFLFPQQMPPGHPLGRSGNRTRMLFWTVAFPINKVQKGTSNRKGRRKRSTETNMTRRNQL